MTIVMTIDKKQKTVSKGMLKARMLEFFREVEKTKQELIVTDNNIPVLKIVPIKKYKSPQEVFASYQGKINIKESDLLAPLTDEWGDFE